MHIDYQSDWLPNCQNAAPDRLPWGVFTDAPRVFEHDEDAVVWFATTLPGPGRALALCARLVLAGGRINYHSYPGYDERYEDYRFVIGVNRAASTYIWPVRCPLLDRLNLRHSPRNPPHDVSAELAAKLERFWRDADLTPLHEAAHGTDSRRRRADASR